ncbi:MAG: acylneuraminate cytidylyltransferase family protein [Candidatus Hadarchaeota archaeon]
MVETNIVKILGVIPAKGTSKTIPKKNIKPLLGRPLIFYTISEARKSKMLSRVVVSSESEKIIALAKKYGAEAPFKRPKDLATPKARTVPAIQHAVKFMENLEMEKYDYVVVLQPTTPFRLSSDIDAALKKIVKTGADSVISVCDVGAMHPARMKKIVNDKLVDIFKEVEGTPRQELPPIYIRNGAIYAVKRDVLMNQNTLRGRDSRPYIMPAERSINIDTMFDFKVAELLMREKMKK